ncbi:spore germination protein [Evansella tamaricis]|uniref:Spore germination protein n=1 Tax=Evansella tamaricis TaxID=2069301 RepID=A0ABS6JFL7_9BACI|nr:spore germination protein [Evansella tamaricis]MBU9712323.1 spore germination protein [Evansella tamaricis]
MGNIQVNFNNFYVNNVENGSGIFSGTNIANGWTTFYKANSGFGSVSQGIAAHNTSHVFDNDMIDVPIDDRDNIYSHKYPDDSVTNVDFGSINVNALINNSTVAVGENNQVGWSGHSKRNHGNGNFTGRNVLANVSNSLNDTDYIDAPINDQDYKPGYMNQTL